MYLLITVIAALLAGLVLIYLVLVVFDREPAAPGSTRAERLAGKRDAALRIEGLTAQLAERDATIADLRSDLGCDPGATPSTDHEPEEKLL